MRAMKFLPVASLCALLGACASAPPPPKPTAQPMPGWDKQKIARSRAKRVSVQGIEGTLTAYDVRDTMDRRGEELGACYATTVERIPRIAGRAEFAIHVLRDGTVGAASYEHSDLGDRELEACVLDVVRGTKFPEPHGGEADVKWAMVLESETPGPGPEHWEPEKVRRVVNKRAAKLREYCELPAPGPTYRITAYVNRRGRVVSAGVISDVQDVVEHLDCIAEGVRKWRMPRPKEKLAKVSFDVR